MEKKIKIIDLKKELPYKFKWKDNVYKLDSERYFRVGDNWEPTFYLFQLDEEVEILYEEDGFEDIEELPHFDFKKFKSMSAEERFYATINEYDVLDKLIKNQKKIIERLNNE